MKFGYARVSTLDQNPNLQSDELEKAGCEEVVVDRVSGTVAIRPGLEKVKGLLRKGDTLVVWRLDRLGRSLRDLIEWAQWLEGHGVALQSLKEAIDTTTPTGKLTFHLFGALAQFERDLIRERTQAERGAAAMGRIPDKKESVFNELKAKIHFRLLNLLDLNRLSDAEETLLTEDLRRGIEIILTETRVLHGETKGLEGQLLDRGIAPPPKDSMTDSHHSDTRHEVLP